MNVKLLKKLRKRAKRDLAVYYNEGFYTVVDYSESEPRIEGRLARFMFQSSAYDYVESLSREHILQEVLRLRNRYNRW